eukprot:TRINITY_DN57923_c0_g1_i1.p1 TRINITY_DN57923_c0_g1~~TRINITY_DN57923_c0_g1_i1.p1  ORF type:complete len:334 (-),score=36.39 TRINITY_DN57923_c0_g1_i1:152-1153(-)
MPTWWGFKRKVDWIIEDVVETIGQTGQPSDEPSTSFQEFEVSDFVQAVARLTDVGNLWAEMPPFFWIAVGVLIYQCIYVAGAIVETWIASVLYNCGWIAYVPLACVVLVSWPLFIKFLVRLLAHGTKLRSLHQRTVQLCGVPSSFQREDVKQYLKQHGLAYSAVEFPKGKNFDGQRKTVEVRFSSIDEMNEAFKQGKLRRHLKMDGVEVRSRPKTGSVSAAVEELLVVFYHMEQLPKEYWPRVIMSCLVTMSLTKPFLASVSDAISSALRIFGSLGTSFGFLCSVASVSFVFLHAGYHAYHDIWDARASLKAESAITRSNSNRSGASPLNRSS